MTQKSSKVALIPNNGSGSGAGTMPTADVNGLPFSTNFTFTDLAIANVDATELAKYDTVVFMQICDQSQFTPSQKNDILAWITAGGKLIIYDSDACSSPVDYSWLPFPFTTNNPGQQGAQGGPLTIVENNTLSSNVLGNQYYIDTADIVANTDAVGDSNVMIAHSSGWCEDMEATNINGKTGIVHAYAKDGNGLMIYNGLDTNYITFPTTMYPNGNPNLQKIWFFELQQPWGSDYNLPCGHPVPSDEIPCSSCTPVVVQTPIDPCVDSTIPVTANICNSGRLLTVNVTFPSVCPNRSVAFAVILTDSTGKRIGIQFCQVTSPAGTVCAPLVVGPLTFPIVDDICATKTINIQVIANYDD